MTMSTHRYAVKPFSLLISIFKNCFSVFKNKKNKKNSRNMFDSQIFTV